jgi:hypothetical protein
MKKCYKCKEDKSFDNYYIDKTRKDNLSNQCKFCKNKYDEKYSKTKRKHSQIHNNKIYTNYNERRRELHRNEPRIRMRDGARRRALRKGFEFNLKSYKDLPEIPEYCPILGIPLICGKASDSNGGGTDNSPSLDRIDNSKGYIEENLQIISRKANQMKSNGDFKDIEKLYMYMKNLINKGVVNG